MTLWEILGVIAGGLTAVGLGSGGIGYAYKAFRSSGDDVDDRVIANQERLIGQLQQQVDDLTGRVDLLSRENDVLKSLVMGSAVPPALDAALTGVASRIVDRVGEVEDHIAQGVLAMTDAVTKLLSEISGTMQEIREQRT